MCGNREAERCKGISKAPALLHCAHLLIPCGSSPLPLPHILPPLPLNHPHSSLTQSHPLPSLPPARCMWLPVSALWSACSCSSPTEQTWSRGACMVHSPCTKRQLADKLVRKLLIRMLHNTCVNVCVRVCACVGHGCGYVFNPPLAATVKLPVAG